MTKATGSEVHVSLANASIIAEKSVGPNAHAVSVRLGVVHGFVVYIASVSDMKHIGRYWKWESSKLYSTVYCDDDDAERAFVREYLLVK